MDGRLFPVDDLEVVSRPAGQWGDWRLGDLSDDLSAVVVRLFDSPTGEVADVLLVARSALAEAAGMLDAVRARFDAGERESA